MKFVEKGYTLGSKVKADIQEMVDFNIDTSSLEIITRYRHNPNYWNTAFRFSGSCRYYTREIILRVGRANKYPSTPSKDTHGNSVPSFQNEDELVFWLFCHEFSHYLQHRDGSTSSTSSKKQEKLCNDFADKKLKERREVGK